MCVGVQRSVQRHKASSIEREAQQCLHRVLHRLPPLVGTKLVSPPHPTRNEALSQGRLLSIPEGEVLEGAHQSSALHSAR